MPDEDGLCLESRGAVQSCQQWLAGPSRSMEECSCRSDGNLEEDSDPDMTPYQRKHNSVTNTICLPLSNVQRAEMKMHFKKQCFSLATIQKSYASLPYSEIAI